MANQSKLKAWVRYDGTGRVISGGPIFQVNKPKVGNWKQIDANLCCNSGSTTTTTTTGGGGGTPTAWFGQISNSGISDQWKACNGFGNSIIVYTSTSTNPLPAGTYLYSDAALTTLIPYAFGAISIQGTVYLIENGRTNPLGGTGEPCAGITTTTSTTTEAPTPSIFAVTNYNAYDACQGSGTTLNLFYPLNQSLGIGTTLFFNPALTLPYDPGAAGNYVRIYFQAENQVCTMNGNVIQSYVACSGITTTTSTTTVVVDDVNVKLSNVSAADACFNSGIVPTTVYTTAPYGNYPAGTVLYFDAQLTQPVNYSYVSNPGIGIVWQCNNGVLSTGSNCF
jgi:hypothetical protein